MLYYNKISPTLASIGSINDATSSDCKNIISQICVHSTDTIQIIGQMITSETGVEIHKRLSVISQSSVL